MWGSEFTYTHITSLLAPPVLRLTRLNLPVGTFEASLEAAVCYALDL
jgi:hypothetical protein